MAFDNVERWIPFNRIALATADEAWGGVRNAQDCEICFIRLVVGVMSPLEGGNWYLNEQGHCVERELILRF